jgi:NitT/TauT family transport system substrate-binding protein
MGAMRLGWGLAAGMLAASTLLTPRGALAEASEVRIIRQFGLDQLPLMVVERQKLIEKAASVMGLGEIKVDWVSPGKTEAADSLMAGQADLAPLEIGQFIAARDRALGTPHEIEALAALAQFPYVLVARNPAIKTIRDFSEHDRIAVPALQVSGPALMLEMAAAEEWGSEHYTRLDGLARAVTDADAAAQLRDGKTELDAHFSRTPYVYEELGVGPIHRVMDSFDIAGPHTTNVLAAPAGFYRANPKLCAAIFAAVQEADALIKKSPGEAAEIYGSMSGGKDISVEDLSDMIGDPDVSYTPAPAGIQRLARFMAGIRRVAHPPDSWKDMFFLDARGEAGN